MSWWRERRGLYAILDPDHTFERDPLEVADALLSVPIAVLQLRCKSLGDRKFYELARNLRDKARAHNVPFVINDRADIARLVEADGLHLGQDDFPIAEARKFFSNGCISLSTHNLAQAKNAEKDGADVIAFGPIFATSTKTNPAPTLGIEELRGVCQRVALPVVAIGGITASNVAQVVATGVPMVTAISSLIGARDIQSEARKLIGAFAR